MTIEKNRPNPFADMEGHSQEAYAKWAGQKAKSVDTIHLQDSPEGIYPELPDGSGQTYLHVHADTDLFEKVHMAILERGQSDFTQRVELPDGVKVIIHYRGYAVMEERSHKDIPGAELYQVELVDGN